MDSEKIKEWFRHRDNQILFLIIAFAVIIRLFYFFKLGSQPIWWDEGDYLAIPKVWAANLPQPEWWAHFTGMRPLLMSIVWFFFMKLQFGELAMRFFTILLPSIATVYLVYAVARDMYNKKIALISAFIMSVYWVHLFYSFRLLTDIPALFLGMLTIYFFYSRYIVKGEKKGLYLSILFGVLTFTARFPHATVLFTCFLFLFLVERKEFFMKKINWKAILLLILLLMPYFIYFVSTNFYAIEVYSRPPGIIAKTSYTSSSQDILGMLPFLFGPQDNGALPIFLNIFFVFMILGIFVLLFNLLTNFDSLFKKNDKKLYADLFILVWIVVQVIFYVLIIRSANDRWLLMLMPPLFMLAARSLVLVESYIRFYSKQVAVLVLIILVLVGGYYQLSHANSLIDIKKTSYQEVKDAALWLKINTPKDTKVITASIVQNEYYSERDSYDFYTNDSIWDTSCGSIENMNDSCSKLTEASFDRKLKSVKPEYMILSVFEPGFTPKWAYDYPQRHNLTFQAMFPSNAQQPYLVIYKFPQYYVF